MAKKKKKAPKKSLKKTPSSPVSIKTVIIAGIIVAAAVALGMLTSLLRTKQLEKSSIVSSVNPQSITIINKETNKQYTMEVKPASGQILSKSPAAGQRKISPADMKKYFKNVSSKESIPHIHAQEAKYLYDSGKAVFIDTRSLSSYRQGHIKGALAIPYHTTAENAEKYKNVLKNKVLITYCSGAGCHISDKVAYKLFDIGYKKVAIFFGGWPEWNQYKYPVTLGEKK